jgi:hypothetical protein
MPQTELERVTKGLRSSRFDTFREAARAAVTLGSDGDQLLAEATAIPGWRGLYATAALGQSRGPSGEPALRELIAKRGPGTSDVRSAALLALAKRTGSAASDVLADAVDDKDASVRDYAVTALAAVGDATAWDTVLARLNTTLGRPRKRQDQLSTVVLATIYLARHAVEDHARLGRVAETLRKHWDRLDDQERAWLEQYWPAVHPGLEGQPLLSRPSAEAMLEYILRDPLFSGTALV